MTTTSFARTVDALLQTNHGTTLHGFIVSRRNRGDSYSSIAADLRKITGGTVDVTRQTITNWHNDMVAA